jgi:MYXO-CTERM domain-containing protein
MRDQRSKPLILAAAFLGLVPMSAAFGQISYGTPGNSYSQSFDSLPATGTSNTWTNNTTLPGWYAFEDNASAFQPGVRNSSSWLNTSVIRAGDGTFITSRLWSLGNTGSSERALGLIEAGQDRVLALVLQNTSGQTLTGFTLSYDGELWNNAGGAAEILDFDYATFSSAPTLADMRADNVAPYTNPGGLGGLLDFITPLTAAGVLDGNQAANRVAGISGSAAVNWLPGQYLVLRWWDDDRGNPQPIDHKLAIDNLSFSATVPSPGAAALLGLGGLLAARRRR